MAAIRDALLSIGQAGYLSDLFLLAAAVYIQPFLAASQFLEDKGDTAADTLQFG